MDISKYKPGIVYSIYIAATPEKVWQALTSAEFSRQYFHGLAVEVEERIGGAFVLRAPDGSVHISGEVIECDRPRKLTVTFNVNWPGLVEALGVELVRYEIEPAGDTVRLTMSQLHDRPISDDILSGGRQGWPAILSSLKSLLETGKASDNSDAAAAADAGCAAEARHQGAGGVTVSGSPMGTIGLLKVRSYGTPDHDYRFLMRARGLPPTCRASAAQRTRGRAVEGRRCDRLVEHARRCRGL